MVSIIVPIYNVAPYLPACLDSIIQQTYRDLEIILVDDGSTDGCAAIADEYKAKDERIRVIHQTNSGLSAARNAGLREATGEYVWFIDSDDYVALNACEILVREATQDDDDVIIFSRQRFTEEGPLEDDILPNERYNTGREYIEHHLTNNFSHSACHKLCKRELLINHHIEFESGRYEDCYFSFRVMCVAQKVKVISDILYFYRRDRVTSIVASINPKDSDVLLTVERLEQWLTERHDELVNADDFKIYVFDWVFSSIMIKYPCKILCNRTAHQITKAIIHDKRFNKYLKAVASIPSAGWKRRIAAWTMDYCYPIFALTVYSLYHIKYHNSRNI